MIDLRRGLCAQKDRYQMLARSVLDFDWMAEIEWDGRALMILAEGLLMYIEPSEVRSLIRHLADAFPGAEMILEVLAFGAVGMRPLHPSLWRFPAELKWSVSDCRQLESWHPRIQLVNEWYVLDHYRQRWGWLAWLAWNPWYRLFCGERIACLHFREGEEGDAKQA